MNATGLAVQSSHTGVAICSINTSKIHNVRQPFSNILAWLSSEATFHSVLHYSAHGFGSFVHSTQHPDLTALFGGGHPVWLCMNIIK